MASESAARRYARAIFELATERGDPFDSWSADLAAMQRVLADETVQAALLSPRLTVEQKRSLVDQVASDFEPLRRNFFQLLIERNRIELLDPIAREFHRLVLDNQGIAEATVTTAVPISEADAQTIAGQLERLIGKRIVIDRHVDPSIIGGLVARVGDRLINGSVAERLAALRTELA